MDPKSKARLLVLFNIFIFIYSLHQASSSNSEKIVSVELYYETLCPDSVDFILNQVVQLFQSPLISVVDLKFVPYGNARLRSNHTIICQR
ncbi:Gamma interferon inducible lysosomal thiol reductase GILT [Parasponia andersonii]|uniref:Gamma interferon inducible lysosomal thiol reductase GILT n=1 Tax=Parasponia andersonii TaxID=3476 RepID=A0A2P5ATY4_PARAD|nr:Gamma interferon inducible lysosomal thiol reductase GILT [Parasponia andersonii]